MLLDKKTILILGGSGFIGTNLGKYLSKKNKIIIVTKNNKIRIHKKNYRVIKADITKSKNLSSIFNKFKDLYIINCSGYIDHKNIEENKKSDIILNHYSLIQKIFENIKFKNIKKFIQIGSSDEYGSNISPLREDMREYPFSTYSFSKTASTHYLQMLHKTLGIKTTVLRVFLAYGPGQDNKRFIPQIVDGCLKNKKFPTSEGKQLRDFIYIDDLCKAVELIINSNNSKLDGEIFNIGTGKPVEIRQMIKKIVKIIGKGQPMFGEIKYRSGENMSLYPSIRKIKKILNWSPKTTLAEGLKKTISYYQSEI